MVDKATDVDTCLREVRRATEQRGGFIWAADELVRRQVIRQRVGRVVPETIKRCDPVAYQLYDAVERVETSLYPRHGPHGCGWSRLAQGGTTGGTFGSSARKDFKSTLSRL